MSTLELTLAVPLDLKVVRASISETISTPFTVSVTVLSPDPSAPISAIVGQPATFDIASGYAFVTGLGARTWSGVVMVAEQQKAVNLGGGEKSLSTYRFDIAPRLWLLSKRRGYRVFQHLSIPEIVGKILAEWHITPVWHIDRSAYPKLEYKIQYGEPDLQFIKRLLEEAGIAHVFEGSETKGSELVLSDQLQANPPRPPLSYVDSPNEASEMEFVTSVKWAREVRPGARTLRDYDFRNPARALFEHAPPVTGVEARLEQYAYDAGGFLIEPGKGGDTPVADDKGIARYDSAFGKGRATRDLDAMRVGARSVGLTTNAFDLCPGSVFTIDNHPHAGLPPSAKLLVTASTLEIEAQGEWSMHVSAVPANVPYRPPLLTEKPAVTGFQSAMVVGPAGQEIHTDEFGRVRVQFPWDREGKLDDRASCWMRVHEGWGGLGYGMITLPRIGQEVLVTFLSGDPDQPVILGREYNAVQQVPYKLPTHKTRSAWKSDSSIGSGGFNEIMFEDDKSNELVYEQAQKDRVRLVKNDERLTIVHDRQILVKNDLEDRTEHNRQRWVGKDLDTVIKQALRERIEGDSHVLVNGHRQERIDGNLSLTVLDDQHEEIGGRYALSSGQAMHIVSGDVLVGEAQDITVKGPGGFVRIDSVGITISGTQVKINAGGSPGQGHGAKPEDPADPPSYEAEPDQAVKPTKEQEESVTEIVPECEIKTIVVECEHGARAYKVTLPKSPKAKDPANLIEVVAADKNSAEKIKTTITLAKPRCAAHKPYALTVRGPPFTVTRTEDVSTVEVYYGEKSIHGELLPLLWPWKDRPVDYTFVGSACRGPTAPVVIRVYPNVEPSIAFKFELESDAIDERAGKRMELAQARGYVEKRGRPAHTAWKFEFKGKIKYGPRSVELGVTLEDKFKKFAWLNLLVKRAIDLFCEVFHKYMGVKLLPIFPKVALTYEGKFKEIDGSWRVGAEWSILFKADPLIGIKVKLDVLEGLIWALGLIPALTAVSRGLLKIKEWAKKKGQTLEIILTISGEIGGELGAKKEAALAKAGVSGAIEGKVKVELAAKASFGSKGVISFAFGAEVGADTGIAVGLSLGNNEKGVYMKGRFALLACKLKFAAWASGKVIWEVKESYEGEYTFWDEKDFSKGNAWYILGNA